MTRAVVSSVTALYALSFVFVALAAIRWPSLIALGALFGEEANQFDRLQALINWRELGILTALPYFLAAFCFHSVTTLLERYRRGAPVWFLLGSLSGFLPFILFDFEPDWWRNPNIFEQCICLAAIITFFLYGFVSDLSVERRKPAPKSKTVKASPEPLILKQTVSPAVSPVEETEKAPVKAKRYRPIPAAIARQRASFAMHGQRALRRQLR